MRGRESFGRPHPALRAPALPRGFADGAPDAAIGCKTVHLTRESPPKRADGGRFSGRFGRFLAARKARRAQRWSAGRGGGSVGLGVHHAAEPCVDRPHDR